jgi:serine/threonine protein kinase
MSKDLEHTRESPEPDASVSAVLGSEHDTPDGLTPLRGERFSKYLLVGEIARGGMGEVFLAIQQGLEGFSKVVVVKRVVSHLTKSADFTRMFIDEARLAARLEHPNIVKTYEFGDHEGQYYTVMEFLAGEDLRKAFHRLNLTPHRRLALALTVHIVAQICNGLHFAHELTDHDGVPLNLVHRDVNPANVIVTYTGEVKVIDFGVAKVNTAEKKTLAGVIKGKIAYMSPEHILSRDPDRRSDVFSTGIILWELLMGRPLFARDCDAATMYAVLNDPIPRPSSERPEIPPQLDAIVARSLARSPDDRFGTADEMRAALDALAASLPKCDGRSIGRMMEKLFGTTRAEAKRSIAQARSLAHNISLVMKAHPVLPSAASPTVVLPGTSSPSGALPTASLPVGGPPAGRQELRWWAATSALASVLGVVALVAFGPWSGAHPALPPLVSPAPPAASLERAVDPPSAAMLASAPPAAPAPPAALSPPASRAAAATSGQGTLTIETRAGAAVYLDGTLIEHGSFSDRLTTSGVHELVVKPPGRPALKRSISITPGRETRLRIEAAPRASGGSSGQPAPERAVAASSRPTSPAPAKDPPPDPSSGSGAEGELGPATGETRPADAPSPAAAAKRPSLDVAATRTAVRSQIAPLQQCYERAKMDDVSLKGGVTARITVAADGTVARVEIANSTLNNPQFEQCITREIMHWHLPRPSGGVAVSFAYPLVFE